MAPARHARHHATGRLTIGCRPTRIRINQQWRICFRWTDAGAADVEIVDYH
jgi:hypothetical protein